MIDMTELRKMIREYCHTELPKAKAEWIVPNIENIRKTFNMVKESGDYERLKTALQHLHSGRNIFRFHIRTREDLKNLWENFLSEVVETPPEKLLENIDERFEKWKQIKGAGRGLISEVLAFYYPQHFAPWNNTVDWYFKELGWGKPQKYSEVLKHLRGLKGIFEEECKAEDINFLVVDHFGWWLKRKKEGTTGQPPKFILNAYLSSRGYAYQSHLVSQFYTALKTKGFVILSGLTGTGKTKIAQELAELLDGSKNNLLFLSVRPDWRDSKALLGYYNPLTGEYHKTSLLEFILRAKEDYEQNREKAMPYFIILDEMNLAHVEYYFADFLSVLESGRDNDGFTKESIKLHDNEEVEIFQGIPKELKLPPNLYIIGTVNMDETTYSFSPKVLDRAFVVEFHDVDLENYPSQDSESELSPETINALKGLILDDLRGEKGKFLARSKEEANKAVRELKGTEYWRVLIELNKALEPYDMHFGYRVVDEIALFFQSAKESQDKGIVEFRDDDEIFDLALLMKVLPKFHGNRKKLEEPLKVILVGCLRQENNSPVKFRVSFTERANTRTLELPTDIDKLNREAIIEMLTNWEKYENNFRFKHTARKVLRMLRQLYEIGFASFS